MLLNKSLLVIVLSLTLSYQKGNDVGRTYTYSNGDVEILNGHVKQIRSFGEQHIGVYVTDTTNFDEKGNQIEEIVSGGIRSYKKTYINTYDKNGRINQTTSVESGNKSNYTLKGTYTYNKGGYSIKVIYDPKNPASGSDLYKYDKDGYLTEQDSYFSPKLISYISKSKYDKNHQLIQIEQRARNGSLELRETFKYLTLDSKGNWIKIQVLSKGYLSTPVDVQIHEVTREIDYY